MRSSNYDYCVLRIPKRIIIAIKLLNWNLFFSSDKLSNMSLAQLCSTFQWIDLNLELRHQKFHTINYDYCHIYKLYYMKRTIQKYTCKFTRQWIKLNTHPYARVYVCISEHMYTYILDHHYHSLTFLKRLCSPTHLHKPIIFRSLQQTHNHIVWCIMGECLQMRKTKDREKKTLKRRRNEKG